MKTNFDANGQYEINFSEIIVVRSYADIYIWMGLDPDGDRKIIGSIHPDHYAGDWDFRIFDPHLVGAEDMDQVIYDLIGLLRAFRSKNIVRDLALALEEAFAEAAASE